MKTVLVMDKMPETCIQCPCSSYNPQANRYECSAELLCRKRYATVKVVDEHTRPSWCRLRPLPQEKKHSEVRDPHEKGYEDEYDYWEIEGWNNCLKEIDMEMKQREQLYIAFAQLERDKQDYKRKIKETTDGDLIGYFKSIIEGCDYAQKILSEKLNAHD